MRYFCFFLLACFFMQGCHNYHKLDFIASNQGFFYLDSINKSNRKVVLPYPIDAFKVAKQYFLKERGAKNFRIGKPYLIRLVNDSTWEVWSSSNLIYKLANKTPRVGWKGIGISMYDGEIKYSKENR